MGQTCCSNKSDQDTRLTTAESVQNEKQKEEGEKGEKDGIITKEKPRVSIYNYEDFPVDVNNSHYQIIQTYQSWPVLRKIIQNNIVLLEDNLASIKKKINKNHTFLLKKNNHSFFFRKSDFFQNGNGYCQIATDSGEYFEGVLKEYALDKGIIVLDSGDVVFSSFKNNRFNGLSKLICLNGDTYEGYMFNGVKQGRGKIFWADGSSFEGTFQKDKKYGYGVYKYENGDVYSGNFKDDMRDGYGNLSILIFYRRI